MTHIFQVNSSGAVNQFGPSVNTGTSTSDGHIPRYVDSQFVFNNSGALSPYETILNDRLIPSSGCCSGGGTGNADWTLVEVSGGSVDFSASTGDWIVYKSKAESTTTINFTDPLLEGSGTLYQISGDGSAVGFYVTASEVDVLWIYPECDDCTGAGASGGVSLTNTYVAFGNASNEITGEAAFTYNISTNTLTADNYVANTQIATPTISGSAGLNLVSNTVTLTGDMVANADSTRSLGSNGTRFLNVYSDEVTTALVDGGSSLSVTATTTSVSGNVVPGTDSSHDIGSTSAKWAGLYTDQIYDSANSNGSPGQVLSKNGSDQLIWTTSGTAGSSAGLTAYYFAQQLSGGQTLGGLGAETLITFDNEEVNSGGFVLNGGGDTVGVTADGIYEVQAQVTVDYDAPSDEMASIRIFYNGSAFPGSYAYGNCNTSQYGETTIGTYALLSVTSGDIISVNGAQTTFTSTGTITTVDNGSRLMIKRIA